MEEDHDKIGGVDFPYFGDEATGHFVKCEHPDVLTRNIPVKEITGVLRDKIIHLAREFADNAEKTNGKSMIILGAGLNHWYHMDMNHRGIINMLAICDGIGKSGGGWPHYVGQEKSRPQTGWQPLA